MSKIYGIPESHSVTHSKFPLHNSAGLSWEKAESIGSCKEFNSQVDGLSLLVEKRKDLSSFSWGSLKYLHQGLSVAGLVWTRLPYAFDSAWNELCPRLRSLAGSLAVCLGEWGKEAFSLGFQGWLASETHTTSLPLNFYFQVGRMGSLNQPDIVRRTKEMMSVNL